MAEIEAESNSFPQGSLWRKWDLHVHSPLSILNNQYPKLPDGTPDWDAYIAKLESLDVAVLAVTDYFTIEGYKKVREYKNKGRLTNIHTILPNIEFRLSSVLASKKDGQHPRRLNFHVIFSDEVSVQDIEEHFLHDIDFYYEGNPQGADGKRKLKPSNLEALGKKLKEDHAPFSSSSDSALMVGATQAVVSHEEISKRLEDARFKGKYLLVFPEEYSNLIEWDGQDHHTRKAILQKADMVFSASDKTREWCLGRDPYTEGVEKYISEFKSLKPCIHGSDAHQLDDIGRPCALRGDTTHTCAPSGETCILRHCWLKADPTFEGLKQLLYEPDERVQICSDDPTPIRSNFTLTRVKISPATVNDDLVLRGSDLEFNGNLVAVTGAKGSGKTALLDLVANCYSDRCTTKDPNSFVHRIADQDPAISTTLVFKDGTEFSKGLKDKHCFENSELVYIAQGQLESYIDDKSNLDEYIHSLIFESPQVSDSIMSFEYSELAMVVKQSVEQLRQANKAVARLEAETNAQTVAEVTLERTRASADLKDAEARISELEAAQTPERVLLAQKKQQTLATLKAKKEDLLALRDSLSKATEFLTTDLSSFNATLGEANTLLLKLGLTFQFQPLSYSQTDLLQDHQSKVQAELTTAVKDIEVAQADVANLEAGVRDHAKALERKRELSNLLQTILAKEKALEAKRQELATVIANRKQTLKQLYSAILKQKAKYDDIITAFSAQKATVLQDLTFNAKVDFEFDGFLSLAEEVLDNRRVTLKATPDHPSEFEAMVALMEKVASGDSLSVDALVDEIERLRVALRGKLKTAKTITLVQFYDWLYASYLHVSPVVKYKKTALGKLSLGQKATVLIKIYLAQGEKPILIDSHDDHLDNEFIMDELVTAIREAKRYRQVVLASNNGNVVINSDAEQIIIANRTGADIWYQSGSIENPDIRKRAIKVLEGGPDAFRQRQYKYRLHQ